MRPRRFGDAFRRLLGAGLFAWGAGTAVAAMTPAERLFRDGLMAETVDRNLLAAIEFYERAAAAADPPLAEALFRKGLCLERLGREEDALSAFDAAATAAAETNPTAAQRAAWRRDRLESARAERVRTDAPPPPPAPSFGPRWEARLESGYSTLYESHVFDRNNATYGSAGVAPHQAMGAVSLRFRTSPKIALGLEAVEFLPATTRTQVQDAVAFPGALTQQAIEHRATYFGPTVSATARRRDWVFLGTFGFGTMLERTRIELTYLDGPAAGTSDTVQSRNSDVALSFVLSAEYRITARAWIGVGLRDFVVFFREYNAGRSPADPFSERQIRQVLVPTLQAGITF